mmetsp:Transcript_20246/g.26821  ORF Transcript_20246/g.26821 Transcript_20246/m.26821 type:complete len:121 (-) Transcript_20246:177-539(-)
METSAAKHGHQLDNPPPLHPSSNASPACLAQRSHVHRQQQPAQHNPPCLRQIKPLEHCVEFYGKRDCTVFSAWRRIRQARAVPSRRQGKKTLDPPSSFHCTESFPPTLHHKTLLCAKKRK